MALSLTGQSIAANSTLEEIEAEIVLIKAAIRTTREAKSDSLNDMQASQKTERQNLTELNNELQSYYNAKAIKTGSGSSSAELIAADYTGSN